MIKSHRVDGCGGAYYWLVLAGALRLGVCASGKETTHDYFVLLLYLKHTNQLEIDKQILLKKSKLNGSMLN